MSEAPDPRTAESDLLQRLREQPLTYAELPYPPKPHHREYVAKMAVSPAGASRGDPEAVYYLYGDERRAVRRFIEANEEFVEGCMADDSNPIARQMPSDAWRVFCEEWQWREGGE